MALIILFWVLACLFSPSVKADFEMKLVSTNEAQTAPKNLSKPGTGTMLNFSHENMPLPISLSEPEGSNDKTTTSSSDNEAIRETLRPQSSASIVDLQD